MASTRAGSGSNRSSGRTARFLVGVAVGALLLSTTVVASADTGNAGSPSAAASNGYQQHFGVGGESDVNVCSDAVGAGLAHCFARIRTDVGGVKRQPRAAGAGGAAVGLGNGGAYDPAYLQSAYATPSVSAGSGQTVAIVDAFDDPNAASDLAAYRAQFALPACTTASGCFTKVDQGGGSSFPTPDVGWSQEISLDLDMVSAICPRCHILLVEAASNSLADLGTAVNTAVALGANVVSNSYGSPEFSTEATYGNLYFNHPGVAMVVSSGDDGYGVQFPAASRNVTAVGGTHLIQNSNTGARDGSETAWSGAGSGCSAYEAKPSWQKDPGCTRRTVADVSAVADPSTPVWVYDTYGGSSWQMFGGTSAAAPIIGAVYALAGNQPSTNVMAALPYATSPVLNDVTSGSNGSCAVTYLCTGVPGYDGPTGLGTPIGMAAFAATAVTNTALTSSTDPSVVGQAVDFMAKVNHTGVDTPTGTVSFMDGGTILGSAALTTTATAVYSTSALTMGTHQITAAYSGDVVYTASTSPTLSQTIQAVPAAPVFTADSPPTSATAGAPYSYTFTASGNPAATFTRASGNLPNGLNLDSRSGVLSGTPTTEGSFTFTVKAANSVVQDAVSRSITIVVSPAPKAGYRLVASDGGIFAFGSAGFYGSTGGVNLTKPIVGMTASPDGRGYWLVASDGGIFTFGSAGFHGSTGAVKLNRPIVGMTS